MISRLRIALLSASFVLLPASAMAAEFTGKQRDEIGDIVRDYLVKNPEVLLEASKELEKRQQLAEDKKRDGAVALHAEEIFRAPGDLVAGNPNGDVTMVEFFDYNCSWCKKGLPEVLSLIGEDKNLRLVMKEFPIFGEDSEYAARAALASAAQGKYWPFHLALLGHEGKLNKQAVDGIATAQGLDLATLKAGMESPEIIATIERNQRLAQAMAINGTPAFIIDRKVLPGYLPKDGLASAIQDVRQTGGCTLC
jgi:protein-disulfide isomerase